MRKSFAGISAVKLSSRDRAGKNITADLAKSATGFVVNIPA
jgi:hypothetical protein